MSDDILLGTVLGAHGLKGEVRVKTFTAEPESLAAYGPLRCADGRILNVVSLTPTKGGIAIVRFDGVASREMAESLKGQKLYVPRAVLPATEEDEFYLADLVGLAVKNRAGQALGQVRGIHDFGAGAMIEIEALDGTTGFVPFTRQRVPVVDIAGRRIVVSPDEVE